MFCIQFACWGRLKADIVDYLINRQYNINIKVDKEDTHNVRHKHARKVIKFLYNSCGSCGTCRTYKRPSI